MTLSRLTGEMLRRYYASGHWRDDTIYSAAAAHARSEDGNGVVVFSEASGAVDRRSLLATADRLAATLHSAGLRRGDRVAVWTPSRVEVAVALLACSRNGYVFCPSLHRDHTVEEVRALGHRMRVAALLWQRGYGADGESAGAEDVLRGLESLMWFGVLSPRPRVADQQQYDLTADIRSLLDADAQLPEERTDPDCVSYLAFTSGTTGEPKGVMHTDNTILAATRAMARDWNLGAGAVLYSMSPLSHNLGFGAMVLALTEGGQLVVHDLPKGASLARRLSETGATFALGVPTHAVDLLSELDRSDAPPISALRGFRISGAAASQKVVAALLDHGIVPQSGYGMTEGGSHHYTHPTDPPSRIIESSGRPFDGHRARIVSLSDPDAEVPNGEVGQITSDGPSVTVGYFDDQERTEESFNRSGWLLTGDLGWADDEGYIRITGRKKELIIRGGHNIQPARIESLATLHPAVDQAAAIPVPDERLGERVGLVVRCAAGHLVSDDEILQHLAERGLSRYDMPEWLADVDELPLTASGKIAKRVLVERLAEGRLTMRSVRFRRES